MNKQHAALLWEEVIKNGKGDNIINKLSLNREKVRFFLEYTKPEMFVSEEINKISLLEIKKLEQKVTKTSKAIKKKQSSSLSYNIMFIFYFITVVPILSLIIYIKYDF